MSTVFEDFVNAGRGRPCGIFKGDPLAAEYSRRLTRSQRKKILRGGPISIVVCEYLVKSKIIRDVKISGTSITEKQLLELLWDNIGNSEGGNDRAEYLYKKMVKEKYPPPKRRKC